MAFVTPTDVTVGSVLTASKYNQEVVENVIVSGRGYVADSKKTSDQGTISTEVNITGLSVTVPMVSGRIYKTTVHLDMFATNVDTTYVAKLTDGSDVQLQRTTARPAYASTSTTHNLTYYETAASTASVTRKVRVVRAAGTGTITVQASATSPALILVEDLGRA